MGSSGLVLLEILLYECHSIAYINITLSLTSMSHRRLHKCHFSVKQDTSKQQQILAKTTSLPVSPPPAATTAASPPVFSTPSGQPSASVQSPPPAPSTNAPAPHLVKRSPPSVGDRPPTWRPPTQPPGPPPAWQGPPAVGPKHWPGPAPGPRPAWRGPPPGPRQAWPGPPPRPSSNWRGPPPVAPKPYGGQVQRYGFNYMRPRFPNVSGSPRYDPPTNPTWKTRQPLPSSVIRMPYQASTRGNGDRPDPAVSHAPPPYRVCIPPHVNSPYGPMYQPYPAPANYDQSQDFVPDDAWSDAPSSFSPPDHVGASRPEQVSTAGTEQNSASAMAARDTRVTQSARELNNQLSGKQTQPASNVSEKSSSGGWFGVSTAPFYKSRIPKHFDYCYRLFKIYFGRPNQGRI